MRLKFAAGGLLIIVICFVIELELHWLERQILQTNNVSLAEEQLRVYGELYENIWKDLVYFPIPESTENEEAKVSFENSWRFERSYGGSHSHEGADVMAGLDKSGYYPVLSMSDGVVEKVGWLEKGGWRIGIRSMHDVYVYYAHLSSYAQAWKAGDTVQAGELLGYMGDTGYGPEGTSGKFDVHLHVGLYVRTDAVPELAVNPYWFLRYLEQNRLRYSF